MINKYNYDTTYSNCLFVFGSGAWHTALFLCAGTVPDPDGYGIYRTDHLPKMAVGGAYNSRAGHRVGEHFPIQTPTVAGANQCGERGVVPWLLRPARTLHRLYRERQRTYPRYAVGGRRLVSECMGRHTAYQRGSVADGYPPHTQRRGPRPCCRPPEMMMSAIS